MNSPEAIEKINEEIAKLEIVIITYQSIIENAGATEWAESIMVAAQSLLSDAKSRIKEILLAA